jgi:hypothetical protein
VDTATNLAVNLYLIGGQVVGSTATTAAGVTAGNQVFTVSVDSAGQVTLDQLRAVVHSDTGNADDARSLSADSLVTLQATITDKDGDSSTAALNIGSNLVFKDDGPSISAVTSNEPVLTVDETTLATNATKSFASSFDSAYDADGAGSINYALTTSGGSSGLVDTATNAVINLYLIGGQVVGSTAVSQAAVNEGNTNFTVSVNSAGDVTLDQLQAIKHPTADPDEPISIATDSLIGLKATITDKDGDSTDATLNIGSNLVFKDDGPSFTSVSGDTVLNIVGASATGVSVFDIGEDIVPLLTTLELTWLNSIDYSGYQLESTGLGQWTAKSTGNPDLFTIQFDSTGQYTFTLLQNQLSTESQIDIDQAISQGAWRDANGNPTTSSNSVYQSVISDSTSNPFDIIARGTTGQSALPAQISVQNNTLGVGGDDVLQANANDVFILDFNKDNANHPEDVRLDSIALTINQFNSNNDRFTIVVKTYVGESNTVDKTFTFNSNGAGVTINNLGQSNFRVDLSLPGLETVPLDKFTIEVFPTNSNLKIVDFDASFVTVVDPVDYGFDFEAKLSDSDGDPAYAKFGIDVLVPAAPISLDLHADGAIEYLSIGDGASFDYGSLVPSQTAWVSSLDGLLVYDYNADGHVTEAKEVVFTMWGNDSGVATDMQALSAYFDVDMTGAKDGVLDANDVAWSSFGVWQDLNIDGIQDEGEFSYLADWDITSIALSYDSDSAPYLAADGDVLVYGQMAVTYADGSTGLAEDVAFAVAPADASIVEPEIGQTLQVTETSETIHDLSQPLADSSPEFDGMPEVPFGAVIDAALAQPELLVAGATQLPDDTSDGSTVIPSDASVQAEIQDISALVDQLVADHPVTDEHLAEYQHEITQAETTLDTHLNAGFEDGSSGTVDATHLDGGDANDSTDHQDIIVQDDPLAHPSTMEDGNIHHVYDDHSGIG